MWSSLSAPTIPFYFSLDLQRPNDSHFQNVVNGNTKLTLFNYSEDPKATRDDLKRIEIFRQDASVLFHQF
uniref:Uncharacterized protein n=1 Tax=Oryzias melastigma TaxID=30732 RepID=A0A3B3CZI7_ORYME